MLGSGRANNHDGFVEDTPACNVYNNTNTITMAKNVMREIEKLAPSIEEIDRQFEEFKYKKCSFNASELSEMSSQNKKMRDLLIRFDESKTLLEAANTDNRNKAIDMEQWIKYTERYKTLSNKYITDLEMMLHHHHNNDSLSFSSNYDIFMNEKNNNNNNNNNSNNNNNNNIIIIII